MKKILFLFLSALMASNCVFAAKLPAEITEFINKSYPGAEIRFDGVIILPDSTIYLPLYPAPAKDVQMLEVKTSYPADTPFYKKPDIVIFNNDFVLLKVITDKNGKKTVLSLNNPPSEVRNGLLPQDMLVPRGLIIPENIKGIMGNLKIETQADRYIRLEPEKNDFTKTISYQKQVPTPVPLIDALKNKVLFISTCYSKNIQVVTPPNMDPDYALSQRSIPIDMEVIDDKFLLVTSYEKTFMNVISLADSSVIKQIEFTTQPTEIVLNKSKNIAYIASPEASCIYVVNLKNMSLTQKIKVNGYCENLIIADNYIFYVDKNSAEVWGIDIKNNYSMKDIGNVPNVSKLVYTDGKLYLTSRTRNRLACIDYNTLSAIGEYDTVKKPSDMLLYKDKLFVLGAEENVVRVIDTKNNNYITDIKLGTDGFGTSMREIEGTNYAIVCDIKRSEYSVIDLSKNTLVNTYSMNIPIMDILVAKKPASL